MEKYLEDIDQTYEGKNKEIMKDLEKNGWSMTPFADRADYFKEQGYDVKNKGGVYMIKPKLNNPPGAEDEKPFYIRQLPKEAQDWLRDKAYKSFIADGDKEEDAQKKAEDFLDEKVYTAEEMYGKDFLNEVGKSKEPKVEDVDTTEVNIADTGKVEDDELDAYTKDLEDYLDKNPDAKKKNYY